jgi:ketosteroid isomerase-like protein
MRTILIPSWFLLLALLPWTGVSGADEGPETTTESFIQALSRADLPNLLDQMAEDATMFGPLPDSPMLVEGRENIGSLFRPFFDQLRKSGDGPIYMNLVYRDKKIQMMGDAAIITFHLGKMPDEPITETYSFSRRSFVLRIINGEWKIAHLHASNVLIYPDESVSD